MTGPGTVPSNGHAWYCTPLAMLMFSSDELMCSSTVSPSGTGGRVASKGFSTGSLDMMLSGETAAAAAAGVGALTFMLLCSPAIRKKVTANTPARMGSWMAHDTGCGLQADLTTRHSAIRPQRGQTLSM